MSMINYVSTSRLEVFELTVKHLELQQKLVKQIPDILSPKVVENLPPYFHGVVNPTQAMDWLDVMLSESRLFVVTNKLEQVMGFVFVSNATETENHIGYLLAQAYWGQGLASELLHAFVKRAEQVEPWKKLVGGVDKHNVASARLLLKLGFKARESEQGNVDFFEYTLNKRS